MGVTKKIIDMQDAYQEVYKYDYALIYMISELVLCKVTASMNINWDECMEARFFSPDKELHIFQEEGLLNAVEIKEDGECDKIIKKYDLANKFLSIGKRLVVYEYIDYDEDGQTFVSLTRLAGIE